MQAVVVYLGPRTVGADWLRPAVDHPVWSDLLRETVRPSAALTLVRARGLQVQAVGTLPAMTEADQDLAQPLAYRLWVHGLRPDIREVGLAEILDVGIESFPEGYRRRFFAELVPAVLPAARQWHVPPSITLAQAILESGWGRSRLSARHHNLFGVKAGASERRVRMASREHRWGRLRPSRETFRTYTDKGESIAHHARLLGQDRRYAHARPVWSDGEAFLEAIAPRYASSPHYVAKVTEIVSYYELDRWDALVVAAAAEDAGIDAAPWMRAAVERFSDAVSDAAADDAWE